MGALINGKKAHNDSEQLSELAKAWPGLWRQRYGRERGRRSLDAQSARARRCG